jgi:hypothetical protein
METLAETPVMIVQEAAGPRPETLGARTEAGPPIVVLRTRSAVEGLRAGTAIAMLRTRFGSMVDVRGARAWSWTGTTGWPAAAGTPACTRTGRAATLLVTTAAMVLMMLLSHGRAAEDQRDGGCGRQNISHSYLPTWARPSSIAYL